MTTSYRNLEGALQFVGGLALIYISSSRVMYILEDMGWQHLVSPLLLFAGVMLLLESWSSDGKEKDSPASQKPPEKTVTDHEQEVLRAAREQGALSVESAALATGLPLADARLLLRRLEREGYAASDVDEAGCQWFAFAGLRRVGRGPVDSRLRRGEADRSEVVGSVGL